MHRRVLALVVALLPAVPTAIVAQSQTSDLIQQARALISANQLDSADVLLSAALATATERADSATTYEWRAILAFKRGSDSATRVAFHKALQLDSTLQVQPDLWLSMPRVAHLLEVERVELRPGILFTANEVEEKPHRLSGPALVYPPDLVRRQVRGRAIVGLTIDTLGRAEERSIDFLATPDSGMNAPLRTMLLASTFAPGRLHGRNVRTMIELAVDIVPGTPPSATSLITAARARIAARQTDSALALLTQALDPATRPTEGEVVYARLVQGIAWTAAGRDTLAREALDAAFAGYKRLTDRGVELAPFLKRLADSVRLARSGRGPGALGTPAVVEIVDAPPIAISHPAITYPPEMQALRVGGTVIVEARVDATGHVLAGTVRVVQSPNPGLEREALRVVAAAVYRPARRGGHAVAVTIRQPITFAPY